MDVTEIGTLGADSGDAEEQILPCSSDSETPMSLWRKLLLSGPVIANKAREDSTRRSSSDVEMDHSDLSPSSEASCPESPEIARLSSSSVSSGSVADESENMSSSEPLGGTEPDGKLQMRPFTLTANSKLPFTLRYRQESETSGGDTNAIPDFEESPKAEDEILLEEDSNAKRQWKIRNIFLSIVVVPLSAFILFYSHAMYWMSYFFAFCFVVLLYLYFPRILGWIFSTIITRVLVYGYRISFETVGLNFWISDGFLKLRLTVENFEFANPKGFVHKNFIYCERVQIVFALKLGSVFKILMLKKESIPLKNDPNFSCFGVVFVPLVEVEGFCLKFELRNRVFNINELTKELAVKEVYWTLLRYWHWNRFLCVLRGIARPIQNISFKNLIGVPFTLARFFAKWVLSAVKSRVNLSSAKVEEDPLTAIEKNSPTEADSNSQFSADLSCDSNDLDDHETVSKTDEDHKPICTNFAGRILEGYRQSIYSSLFPAIDQFPNELELHVIRARNLPIKNREKRDGVDSMVLVRMREQAGSTSVRYRTCKPMYYEKLVFHVTDPSTVLHLRVVRKDIVAGDECIGQWRMTLKYLMTNPKYCWYVEDGFSVSRSGNCGSNVTIRGWFPLHSKRWDNLGECGELNLCITWRFNPLLSQQRCSPSRTALGHLDCNSHESTLRLGSQARVEKMLDTFPLLLMVQRFLILRAEFYFQDLFRGEYGTAELRKRHGKALDGIRKAEFSRIDLQKAFQPKEGEPGITIYAFLFALFIKGLLPKVLKSNVLGSALSQTTEGVASLFMNKFHSVTASGINPEQFIQRMSKELIRKVIRGQRKSLSSYVKHVKRRIVSPLMGDRIDAEDEDFLLEPIISGTLCKVSISDYRKVSRLAPHDFKICHFELKGSALFYKPSPDSHPRKVLMSDIMLLALDRDNESIYIRRKEKITVCRVPCNRKLKKESDYEERVAILLDWYSEIKDKGVSCTILN